MYVTDEMIRQMELRYGVPASASFSYRVTPEEYVRIHSSQKHERNHDCTLYIRKGDQLVVIAKPFYPPGLYRAPSGGLRPGETFDDGIRREMVEETGCEIRLDRFLLRASVEFTDDNQDDRTIHWRSFVFTADYVSGDFQFTDIDEIREVRLAAWEEFAEFGRIMRSSDIGGLHYRADLHEQVATLM